MTLSKLLLRPAESKMGRIHWPVRVENYDDPSKSLKIDALVDTGAAHLVLPAAWKDRLGTFKRVETVELETASQATLHGEICGPVVIQLDGFRAIVSEVIFIEMTPDDGQFEPLIGYTVLELSQASIDMLGHQLRHVKYVDLK